MRECLQCGKPLPPRKERGHRERDYCSDACRQRACRSRNKYKYNVERAMKEESVRFWNKINQEIHRETWQDEIEDNDRFIKLLLDELQEVRNLNKILQKHNEILERRLAEKEGEIARLNVLLESMSKKKRP